MKVETYLSLGHSRSTQFGQFQIRVVMLFPVNETVLALYADEGVRSQQAVA